MFPITIMMSGAPLNIAEAVVCLAAAVVLSVAFNYIFDQWKERVSL